MYKRQILNSSYIKQGGMMDQGSQPAPQPQYNGVPMQPKKKKTGLIIGIVLGVIALIAIISAVLVYFLWWQSPEKMVTDAVSNAIMAKKMTADGKVVIDMRDQGKIELNVKTATESGKSKVNIDAKLDVKGVEKNIPLKGDAVLDSDGFRTSHSCQTHHTTYKVFPIHIRCV